MTQAVWWLQVAYALGFFSMFLAGAGQRRRRAWGWGIAVLSEVAFTLWATIGHVPSAYPWIFLWAAVYTRNWWRWTALRNRENRDAIPSGPAA